VTSVVPEMPEMPEVPALPETIRAVVAAVPGVTAVYPAKPAPLAALSDAAAALGLRAPAEPVAVASTDEGLEIAVSIGVSGVASAAETCRAVYDAVAAHLAGTPAARIRVVVATVD
jgi:hypothetical protein